MERENIFIQDRENQNGKVGSWMRAWPTVGCWRMLAYLLFAEGTLVLRLHWWCLLLKWYLEAVFRRIEEDRLKEYGLEIRIQSLNCACFFVFSTIDLKSFRLNPGRMLPPLPWLTGSWLSCLLCLPTLALSRHTSHFMRINCSLHLLQLGTVTVCAPSGVWHIFGAYLWNEWMKEWMVLTCYVSLLFCKFLK